MKKLIYSVLLSIFCVASIAGEVATTGRSYLGLTGEGLECSVEFLRVNAENNSDVILWAKLGGKGIPFYLGGLNTKFRVFRMVRLTSDHRVISLASEGDPQLELVYDNDDQPIPSSYILILGGLTGPSKKIICNDLQ